MKSILIIFFLALGLFSCQEKNGSGGISGSGSIKYLSNIEYNGYIIETNESQYDVDQSLPNDMREEGNIVVFSGVLSNEPSAGGIPQKLSIEEIQVIGISN